MAAPNIEGSGEQYSCEFGSAKYYAYCGFGGILSCGITHTAVVPLDLVKCRIQVDPGKYKNILNGFKVTLREDGARGLAKGWAPTFIGYSMQGLCKFGFYEVFKILYSNMLGEVSVFSSFVDLLWDHYIFLFHECLLNRSVNCKSHVIHLCCRKSRTSSEHHCT